MRSPILIALAVVLGATLWLQQGEDGGDTVEVADRRGKVPPASRAAAAPVATGAPTANNMANNTANAPATQADPPRATGDWLVDSVQRRQALVAQNEALPPARQMNAAAPSAWAPALPPPPPPPAKQARADSEVPVAPRFPHQWVGRFDDDAGVGTKAVRRAVISGPVSTWVAKEGDVIEGQWRVDQIQERVMRLTYLPLQQSQTVAMK